MKIIAYALYWTVIAPVLFIVILDMSVYPLGLAARAVWRDAQPLAVRLVLIAFGLAGFASGIAVVVWVWRKFRESLAEVLSSDSE